MSKTIIYFFVLFIIMVLVQAVIFNQICLFGVALPLVFIYFIVRLPITLSTNWVLTLSFLLGLSVDIFSNTQGMNALACTITAMMRRPILRLYFPREDDLSNPEPSIRSLGMGIYIKYLLTIVIVYCFLLFMIEAFSLFSPLQLLLRIIASSALTFILILGLDSLTNKKTYNRST
ncbi:MAG: rod shape-determining protein MreD [Muribaculaceae bacterium]|nr:rod shape-determining protein MreD [Muribaculaceae bacterium]